MRLTSEMWISALLRHVFAQGGYGAIARRGATQAGAIFVIRRRRSGTCDLYSPAPQTDYTGHNDERLFTLARDDIDDAAVSEYLKREERFDPDIWVVEVEIGQNELAQFVEITMLS